MTDLNLSDKDISDNKLKLLSEALLNNKVTEIVYLFFSSITFVRYDVDNH